VVGERPAGVPPLPSCAGQPTPAHGVPYACRAGGHAAPSPHSHADARVVGGIMDGDARSSPRAAVIPAPQNVVLTSTETYVEVIVASLKLNS